MPLTPDERKELSDATNALAFDLLRVRSQSEGTVPPCWLCMSPDAKREAIANLATHLNDNPTTRRRMILPVTADTVRAWVDGHDFASAIRERLTAWTAAEEYFKEQREAGNPRAYFAA